MVDGWIDVKHPSGGGRARVTEAEFRKGGYERWDAEPVVETPGERGLTPIESVFSGHALDLVRELHRQGLITEPVVEELVKLDTDTLQLIEGIGPRTAEEILNAATMALERA